MLLCAAPAMAHAQGVCPGVYSATLLKPLPTPTVVALNVASSSSASSESVQAFMSGLRAAGVTTTGTPTALLRVTYQVAGEGGSTPGGPAMSQAGNPQTGWSSWSNGAQSALQGGISLALPDIPSASMFNPRTKAQSGLLMLRAEIRNSPSEPASWIAVVQCTVRTPDTNRLARQLGYVLGGALGKRVDKARM